MKHKMTLKEFRKKYNLTQKELAEKIGITPTTISMYENGKWIMNQAVIDRIKEEYGEYIQPVRSRSKKKRVWRIRKK